MKDYGKSFNIFSDLHYRCNSFDYIEKFTRKSPGTKGAYLKDQRFVSMCIDALFLI
jgi:hypothetical protein